MSSVESRPRALTEPPNFACITITEPRKPKRRNESKSLKKLSFFEHALAPPIIDIDKIKDMSWAGIPTQYRARIWRMFLDYEPINIEYRYTALEHKRGAYYDCLSKLFSEEQKMHWTPAQRQTMTQIERDLPRTQANLFRVSSVQSIFSRILFVWAVRHPASGYVQGMNDLLHPFFITFVHSYAPDGMTYEELSVQESITFISREDLDAIEADCFWCFSKLMNGIQDVYTRD